ncbi:MAG: NUDIX hydrolase N-terminal domain-containing protein, partial [Anaerolineae bacterium]|nr:NUDIX hydrolase N-terminal domain-containing protein [Anaerolineae bacterium]
MNTSDRQALYLIADELRGMATIGRHFANNPYEVERAHRINELAATIAALAEQERTKEEVQSLFNEEPWHRISPAIGTDAAVFDEKGRILLIKRAQDQTWAMPGGHSEIGYTPSQTAIKELWEEA